MRYSSMLVAALIATSGWSSEAQAQSSQAVPAEFPPSSFKGRQYVDSTGCVFIRAGIDGAVTWVPRMTRARQQVCGFQPTLSAAEQAKAIEKRTAVAPEPAPEPTPAPKAEPEPKAVAAAPTPAPAPAPAPKTAKAAPPPTPKPAAATAKPAPVATVEPAQTQSVATNCPERAPLSQKFLVSEFDDVRCGPQDAPHVTIKDGPPSPDATIYTLPNRPQPAPSPGPGLGRSVFETLPEGIADLRIPEGFQPVWQDDRLNPHRGPQGGKALAERPSFESFQAAGQAKPFTEPALGFAATPEAKPDAEPTKKASHRYVQIGAFSDPDRAKSTAQYLANSGLPARMGPYKKAGKSYTLVLVGPFRTQAQLDGGLKKVQGLGYKDANLKK